MQDIQGQGKSKQDYDYWLTGMIIFQYFKNEYGCSTVFQNISPNCVVGKLGELEAGQIY